MPQNRSTYWQPDGQLPEAVFGSTGYRNNRASHFAWYNARLVPVLRATKNRRTSSRLESKMPCHACNIRQEEISNVETGDGGALVTTRIDGSRYWNRESRTASTMSSLHDILPSHSACHFSFLIGLAYSTFFLNFGECPLMNWKLGNFKRWDLSHQFAPQMLISQQFTL